MTEEEALKKWCPFSRVSVGYGAEGRVRDYAVMNRLQDPAEVPTNSFCFASGCAAWVWEKSSKVHGRCGLAAGVK